MDLNGKKVLTLERELLSDNFTQGRLLWNDKEVGKTLEGPIPSPSIPERGAIPEGDYALGLRLEGGQHTSYRFRFGNWHRGMIQIQGVEEIPYVYFLIGNEAGLSYGNVLIGQGFHEENLLGSEEAYQGLYEELVGELENGGEVVLRINNN